MSFASGTVSDTLYCMPASGAALASTVTETVISANTAANPPYQLPALNSIWGPSYGVGRALRVIARGIFGTTGTPALTVDVRFGTAQGTNTNAMLAGTGAFTTASGVANGFFELEFDLVVQAVGITTTSVVTAGVASFGVGNNATTTAATTYMVGSTAAITGMNPTTSYYLEAFAKWGTSSASNTITCTQFLVLALN